MRAAAAGSRPRAEQQQAAGSAALRAAPSLLLAPWRPPPAGLAAAETLLREPGCLVRALGCPDPAGQHPSPRARCPALTGQVAQAVLEAGDAHAKHRAQHGRQGHGCAAAGASAQISGSWPWSAAGRGGLPLLLGWRMASRLRAARGGGDLVRSLRGEDARAAAVLRLAAAARCWRSSPVHPWPPLLGCQQRPNQQSL